jgi:DNA-binding transcriptional MerR regulator
MNNIKTTFSIKDLENLSGIKAHTIRIWEKRYNLLEPDRTDTNIRNYSLDSFKKLLNVTFLYNNGYKISKIASLTSDEIISEASKLVTEKALKNQFVNEMKLAMLNFDQYLFEERYQKMKRVLPFNEIFIHYFIPFLEELGLLWQTNSINPAHEHFITNLIKQKVLINTEALIAQTPDNKEPGFVLFLPDNEIHDLGIAFLNYEILLRGYRTVYLGESVPLDSLETFTSNSEKLIFVSYFTVAPATEDVLSYLQDFKDKILDHCASELWILGCMTKGLEKKDVPKNIKIFAQIDEVLKMFP